MTDNPPRRPPRGKREPPAPPESTESADVMAQRRVIVTKWKIYEIAPDAVGVPIEDYFNGAGFEALKGLRNRRRPGDRPPQAAAAVIISARPGEQPIPPIQRAHSHWYRCHRRERLTSRPQRRGPDHPPLPAYRPTRSRNKSDAPKQSPADPRANPPRAIDVESRNSDIAPEPSECA